MVHSGNRVVDFTDSMTDASEGSAECLALNRFEELELAQWTTPPGPDFTAEQKGV